MGMQYGLQQKKISVQCPCCFHLWGIALPGSNKSISYRSWHPFSRHLHLPLTHDPGLCSEYRSIIILGIGSRCFVFRSDSHVPRKCSVRQTGSSRQSKHNTLSRVGHSSHARSGGTCIWTLVSCHLCVQQNVAAAPWGHWVPMFPVLQKVYSLQCCAQRHDLVPQQWGSTPCRQHQHGTPDRWHICRHSTTSFKPLLKPPLWRSECS